MSVTIEHEVPVDTVDGLYQSRYEAELRRATLLVGSAAVAQDVVSEAFCDVIRRWDSIREPAAYLNRAVLNGCRQAGKRRRREAPTDPAEQALAGRTVSDEFDHLADAVETLPWKQRAVVVLKYYEGRTEAEIAEQLGIRPGSVGPTARRALDRLRKEVAR
ncbi:MAG: sigma-70 family RNA polymerase sigma factor [Actinomycetota bacterium]